MAIFGERLPDAGVGLEAERGRMPRCLLNALRCEGRAKGGKRRVPIMLALGCRPRCYAWCVCQVEV